MQSGDGNKTDNASFKSLLTTFGAVPVGGRNFFRLLQNGEAVLLFPGGVREVCSLPDRSQRAHSAVPSRDPFAIPTLSRP